MTGGTVMGGMSGWSFCMSYSPFSAAVFGCCCKSAVNPQSRLSKKIRYASSFWQVDRIFFFVSGQNRKPGPQKGRKHDEIPRTEFGRRLFRTRKSRGLTQTEFGKQVGLSKRAVSYYEGSAQEGPPLSTLTRMAQVLGVTVSYLLGESTQKAIKSEISPQLKKHIKMLESLPSKEQKTILNIIEIAAEKTRKSEKEDE